MDDGGVAMRASASLRDVAAVAAAVEAAEARLSALEAVGAPACDDDEPQPTSLRVRALSSPRANHVRRAAPDPSAASLLSVKVRATQRCARASRAHCSAPATSAPPAAHRVALAALRLWRMRFRSANASSRVPTPCDAALRRRLLLQATPLFGGGFISGAEHENDRAEVCIVCEPGA